MSRVVVVKPRRPAPRGPSYHVHGAACRDLRVGGKYLLDDAFTLTADTGTQVAESVYPRTSFDWEGEHDPWYEGDFRFFDCTGLPYPYVGGDQ